MSGFDHVCEKVVDLQTAQGKLKAKPSRFQIHCWAKYRCWYIRFGEDWFKEHPHLSFTISVAYCPFCGKDLMLEYREYYLSQIHKAIKSWVRLEFERLMLEAETPDYIRIHMTTVDSGDETFIK